MAGQEGRRGIDENTYRRFTIVAAVTSVAATAGGVLLLFAIGSRPRSGAWETIDQVMVWSGVMISAAVIGALLARNQPRNPLGWWLAGGGALGSITVTLDEYAALTLEARPGIAPGGTIALLLSSVALFTSWSMLGVHVALRFPTGQLLSRRWRWAAHLGTAAAVLCGIEIFHPGAFDDDEIFNALPGVSNPIGIPGFGAVAEIAFGVGILALFAATFVGVASLVVRARRASGVEKLQVRWVAFGAVTLTVLGMAFANGANAVDDPWRGILLAAAGGVPLLLIASVGIAVLRHGLFDINIIIRRTVIYTLLASFVALTYIGVAVGVGGIVGRSGKGDLPLSIVATAVVAVAFQPVRRRFEAIANRLVYGEVVPPYELMSGISRRMGGALSSEAALNEVATAVGRGLRAASATVRLFLPETTAEAVWVAPGEPSSSSHTLRRTVTHGTESVGEISVTVRDDDPPGHAELRVLDDLVSHAGVALANLRLTAELQQRLAELRASRQRLVEAQNEERRRMERDIHDGAQQQLVVLQIKLGLVRTILEDSPDEAAPMLVGLQGDAREALETLRDLARGLFPPTLTERGLAEALRSHIDKTGLPATVDAEALGGERFDATTEAAVYFCIREALQNASKHAPDSPIEVHLGYDPGTLSLTFAVHDHGPGFDAATVKRGSGLQNMVDRIEALDGTLTFSASPGHGTTVNGSVPVAPAPAPAPTSVAVSRTS